MVSGFLVNLQDQVIKMLCDFMSRSSSWQVTILSSLVFLGTLEKEI